MNEFSWEADKSSEMNKLLARWRGSDSCESKQKTIIFIWNTTRSLRRMKYGRYSRKMDFGTTNSRVGPCGPVSNVIWLVQNKSIGHPLSNEYAYKDFLLTGKGGRIF